MTTRETALKTLDKLEDFIQEGCSARPEDKHDALEALMALRAVFPKTKPTEESA